MGCAGFPKLGGPSWTSRARVKFRLKCGFQADIAFRLSFLYFLPTKAWRIPYEDNNAKKTIKAENSKCRGRGSEKEIGGF
jgi:hypothetical protein